MSRGISTEVTAILVVMIGVPIAAGFTWHHAQRKVAEEAVDKSERVSEEPNSLVARPTHATADTQMPQGGSAARSAAPEGRHPSANARSESQRASDDMPKADPVSGAFAGVMEKMQADLEADGGKELQPQAAAGMRSSPPRSARLSASPARTVPEVMPAADAAPAEPRPWPVAVTLDEGTAASDQAEAAGPPPLAAAAPTAHVANLLRNGRFGGFEGWQRLQTSDGPATLSLQTGQGCVIWERRQANGSRGSLGIYQDLAVPTVGASSLKLSLDVWVDAHVPFSGAQRPGSGGVPVCVTLYYREAYGRDQRWDHGFCIADALPGAASVDGQASAATQGPGAYGNIITHVPRGQWRHVDFELIDDTVRTDPTGQAVLPRPAQLTRIALRGTGCEFRAAVGNVCLRKE